VILSEKVEQLLDLNGRKAANIAADINIAWRRTEEDEAFENARLFDRDQYPDHCADRVTDKNAPLNFQLVDDINEIIHITCKAGVFGWIISRSIRAARAHMVEQYCAEIPLEIGGDMPLHILVAAVTVSENHLPGTVTPYTDVISIPSRHVRRIPDFAGIYIEYHIATLQDHARFVE
jgi:hypothetical protein